MNTGWIKTDDLQFVRKINKARYEIIDIFNSQGMYLVSHHDVDLDEYSCEEIIKCIKSYGYKDIADIVRIYGEDSNQIIAECIVESMCCFNEYFQSLNDLSQWLKTFSNSLDISEKIAG